MSTGDWYRFRVEGRLDPRWTSWFDGLELTQEPDGTTTLDGPVADQAALHGLLARVRDTGLTLVSVTRGTRQGADPGNRYTGPFE